MKKILVFVFSLIIITFMTFTGYSESKEPDKYGGVLKMQWGLPNDIPFGDPMAIRGPATVHASPAIERLLLPGEKPGVFQYVLATGYKLAPDKSYYDVFLRKGVLFHDGTPFNAEAVKWNLDRVLEAKRPEFGSVESFEVIDDHTIRLNLKDWNNRILNDLTHDVGYIISPTAFKANGGPDWAMLHPVGTGAFEFIEAKPGYGMIWKKNKNYWGVDEDGNKLPYLDGFEIPFITDSMVQDAALLSGEIDGELQMLESSFKAFESKPDKYTLWASDNQFAAMTCFNSADPDSAWHDVRMRQAFEYAINKDAVVKATASHFVKPVYNIIKGCEQATPTKIIPRRYDPEKAKKLIHDAGYGKGLDFKLYMTASHFAQSPGKAWLIYQEQLGEVGLRMEIVPLETAAMRELSSAPVPDNNIYTDSLRGNASAPIDVVIETLAEGTINFRGAARPPEWPSLMDKAVHMEDPDEQLDLLAEMDKLAYDQAVLIPTQTSPMVTVISNYVHEFKYNREGLHLQRCWMDKDRR